MDIQAGTVTQVKRALEGDLVEIHPDVQEIARRLQEIDPALRLRYSEAQGVFVVYEVQDLPDGAIREHLVTTARELDQRLVNRILELSDPGYDFAGELERLERQAERDSDHAFEERTGENAERLAHAVRKDLGLKQRIFVPGRGKAA